MILLIEIRRQSAQQQFPFVARALRIRSVWTDQDDDDDDDDVDGATGAPAISATGTMPGMR